jgi:hypothetical protein
MISDRDVGQAAVLIVKRYGDDAMIEAAERDDQLPDEGDVAGAETWQRTKERQWQGTLSVTERLVFSRAVLLVRSGAHDAGKGVIGGPPRSRR